MYKAGADKPGRDLASAGFFIFLNILDYLTTHLLVSTGGLEIMPIGAAIIRDYGLPGLLVYKSGIPVLLVVASLRVNFSRTFWNLLNGAFTGIVIWNSLGAFSSIFIG